MTWASAMSPALRSGWSWLACSPSGRGASGARAPLLLDERADLGLALFSAISSLWSGSVELSVTEADRVLVYLGFFLAAFLIAQTDQRRQRFAEGIAIALIGSRLLGLASRLLPHVLAVGPGLGSGPRLRYPLGYWNANGVAFGIGDGAAPLDEPALADRRPALARGRGPAGPAAGPLLHLLARRPAGAGRRLRLPARPLPRPPLAAGDAGDRRPRRRCRRCSRSRHRRALADNLADPGGRRPGRHGAADPARRDRR